MPKALDPFWEHGIPEDGSNRQRLNCKLCGQPMTRGITRLKYHLAKIPRCDVGPCLKVEPKLMRAAHDALQVKDGKKEATVAKKAQLAAFGIESSRQSISPTAGSGRGSTATRSSSYFVPRTTPGGQPSIKSLVKKREKKEADKVMAKCLYWSDLPLSITRNNPFWQPMCDAIAIVGPGYRSATYEELRGPLLQGEKKDINSRLTELKQ